MTVDGAKYGDKDVTAKVLAILTPGTDFEYQREGRSLLGG
jgi:hypothetical protein